MKLLILIMSWFSGLWAGPTLVPQNQNGYEQIILSPTNTVSLIPNFVEKYALIKIVEDNKCLSAINAGFYDKKGEALGLFKINGKKTSDIHSPVTINGYLSSVDGEIVITDEPVENSDWIFQTGPILWQYEKPRIIKMTTDKMSRRSVVVRDVSGNVGFLHFYELTYLTDLPDILKKWATDNNFQLSTAINLDGGGASGFYSPERTVNELEPLGAVLCVR